MYPYVDYLPGYLQEVQELQALGEAADPLAEDAYFYIRQQYHNQLIETADEKTVERWEAILKLPHVPDYALDIRRQRILLRWQSRLRITIKKLREILETITGADCRVTVDSPRYAMAVDIYEHDWSRVNLPLIQSEIYRLKPANITLAISVVAQTDVTIPLWVAVAPSLERCYTLTPQLPARSPDATVSMFVGATPFIGKSYEIEVQQNEQ